MNNLDEKMSKILGVSSRMVRFYAVRMIMEIVLGKQLTKKQGLELYNVVSKKFVNENL